ncbi:dTDP-glucose 4,6-dehydratase [Roseimaritima ulvae]|uniref:dTDP-glucose 4,6-dehydratase n=1 Tax=Roseimaritima ulvae TaxID=980254 RepID=A0A5B9QX63_9BACT|nr:dTDP-glucose 4,6-dehydratase [Roseimaritima ulvae]QEG42479.1 dTDP-glucose 4,6-dehydratase 2 [Roseimaritima ulvae]
MQTLLLTGGAGFIGGCFVRRAVESGRYKIVNLDALTYAGNLDSIPGEGPNHVFVQGSISDGDLVGSLLEQHRPDAVLNFAAESHVDRSIDGPGAFIDTNIGGTFRLLNATLGYWKTLPAEAQATFRFLHVSTDEVYGSLGAEGYFTETTAYSPNSPYSASKAASDHLVRAWLHTYGLPTLITNCSNNYGPYQFPEKLIPLMTLNAIEGKPLPVYGDGMNVRDWLYVEDHCSALETVLDGGQVGETYNVGGNCEQTNIDIVKTICRTVSELLPDLPHRCEDLITYVTDRPGHDRRYAIDASKIKDELGWTPQSNFADGIRQTVQWYIENTSWVENITSGKYQRERLGVGGRG